MRVSRLVLLVVLLLVVGASLLSRCCRTDERQAIRVEEDRVVVTNLTGTSWSDVTLWLNEYYRAQAPSLAPNQRLEVPLDVFVAGFGQRFDRERQPPAGLVLTAHGGDGTAITLTWGNGRRK